MGKFSFIYSVNPVKGFLKIEKILKKLPLKSEKICYVTLNKSGASVLDFFEKNSFLGKERIIIDGISKKFQTPEEKEGIFNVDENYLTKFLKRILEIVKKEKCKIIIFDSISDLEVYYDEEDILSFVKELLSFSESKKVATHIVISFEDEEKSWIKKIISKVGKLKRIDLRKV